MLFTRIFWSINTKKLDRVFFFSHPNTQLLDLAGPTQVFYECGTYGHPFELIHISILSEIATTGQILIHQLRSFQEFEPRASDLIFISGFDLNSFRKHNYKAFFAWLQKANKVKATICSICVGAFLLAESQLLNRKKCTTHWRYILQLKKNYPKLKVVENVVFTKDENIYTSAGITTGIDLALHLVEARHGKVFAAKVAKEMVVYIRRNPEDHQESVFIEFKNHPEEKLHLLQDWIHQNLHKKITLAELGDQLHVSPRTITRLFRKHLNLSTHEYILKLRIEKAQRMYTDPAHKLSYISEQCGIPIKRLRAVLNA